MPRTTNSLEGWHGAIQKSFGGCNLNIFKFLESLINLEQAYQKGRIAKIERGEEPEKIALAYRKLNARILKIVNTYKSEDNFDYMYYLRSLAHNITFNS